MVICIMSEELTSEDIQPKQTKPFSKPKGSFRSHQLQQKSYDQHEHSLQQDALAFGGCFLSCALGVHEELS